MRPKEYKRVHLKFTYKIRVKQLSARITDQLVPHRNTTEYLKMNPNEKLKSSGHIKENQKELQLKFKKMVDPRVEDQS